MMKKQFLICGALLILAACAAPVNNVSYKDFRKADPHSILILPALNQTVSIEAPEFFLSTVSRPFAERGYYTFPAHMVKRVLEEEGLSDTLLIYEADASNMGRIFDCDSALYISIEKWESRYVVLATTTTVEFTYRLKSCKSGATIWENQQALAYTPSSDSSGNLIADLVVMAVAAAMEKAAPNYIPLAQQANSLASGVPGHGLPAGPYLADEYLNDLDKFPSETESKNVAARLGQK